MDEYQKDSLEYLESALDILTSDDDFTTEQKQQVITFLWRAYRATQYTIYGDEYEVSD